MGATDLDLAEAFDVDVRTISNWKVKHKGFFQALRTQKDGYDDAIERSLAMRALGYSHPETDIRVINGEIVKTHLVKHYPPDTKAALAWLYNRRTTKWHPQPEADNNEPSPSLNINFTVSEAVSDIKVTNAKP